MKFLTGLLLASGSISDSSTLKDITKTAYERFKEIINIVLPVALGVVLLVGTVFAIVLGVNYSKAESADKRTEAKNRLVGAIVGFLITLVIIAVIYGVLNLNVFENIINGK